MTEVTTTLRSAYLAGPMRGIPQYNFPEFHKQAAWLRANGWTIFSPAERDEADETIDHSKDQAGWADHLGLDYFMQFDLAAVCSHDAVILMEGWEESQGARLEAMVAVEVGHPVFEIVVADSSWAWGRVRKLEHVNPAYIAAEFIAGTKGYDGLPTVEAADPNIEPGCCGQCGEGGCGDIEPFDQGEGCQVEGCFDGELCGQQAGGLMDFIATNVPGHDDVFDADDLTGLILRLDADGSVRPATEEETADALAYMAEEDVAVSALPHSTAERKDIPMARGVLDYFPAALVEVAKVSKAGNDKHNPGQDMHHARGKSTDHADCILRHLVDRGAVDPETGQRHSAMVAWRALALLQQELEDAGAPLARGARLPEGSTE